MSPATVASMATEKDDDVVANVRLPRDWLARADQLVTHLEKREEVRAYGRVSRSMVLRLAVLRGIEALESEYSGEKTSATKEKRRAPKK
jgi:hypothetical protein